MKNLHVSLQVLLNAKEAESEYEKAVVMEGSPPIEEATLEMWQKELLAVTERMQQLVYVKE